MIAHRDSIVAFSTFFNFFCNFTVNQIRTGQGTTLMYPGLPYNATINKINAVITECNGTLANKPTHWPNASQVTNMTFNYNWGYVLPDEWSINFKIAKAYLNTSFTRCINDTLTPWSENILEQRNNETLAVWAFLGCATLLGIGTYVGYKLYSRYGAPNCPQFLPTLFRQQPAHHSLETSETRDRAYSLESF